MANARKSRVMRLDTTADFTGIYNIQGIKFIGPGDTAAATINADANSGGTAVWTASGDKQVFEEVCLRLSEGFGITIANSAVVYLYLK
jgi:hypothetical protein